MKKTIAGLGLILLVLGIGMATRTQASGQGPVCSLEEGRSFTRHYSCPRLTSVTRVQVLGSSSGSNPVVVLTCTEFKVVCQ